MDYSIVIPVYNCVEYTEKCIKSIYAVSNQKNIYTFEIIIVDNNSSDYTPNLLKECKEKYSNFDYVTNEKNFGVAKACNIGADKAKGKYIIFLNNDTEVLPDWDKYLVETIEKNEAIWIVGSKCLYPDNTIQHAGVVFGDDYFPFHIYRYFPGDFPPANIETECQCIAGACFIIEKDIFFSLGRFDETFINGLEDVDLCLKVKEKDRKIIYQPKSTIIHYESQTPKQNTNLPNNSKILFEKWGDFIKPGALKHYNKTKAIFAGGGKTNTLLIFKDTNYEKEVEITPDINNNDHTNQLKQKDQLIKKKNKELKKIYSSELWKIANKLNRFLVKTKTIYLIKALLILKRQGLKALINKSKEKIREIRNIALLQNLQNTESFNLKDIQKKFNKSPQATEYKNKTVDIIIPVYNGYQFLEPLFNSVYKSSDISFNLIIINDKSTDERVAPYLDNLSKKHKNISIFHNRQNLGFVKSVNTGLKKSKNDIIILNTDVIVPENWLSRLMYPINYIKGTASVTPMSNSSTITSFPNIMQNNILFEDMPIEEIDSEFRKLNYQDEVYIPTATGHGFCMAMSKKAVKKIGLFDEEAFGRGNGEENDWCLKARLAGFKNFIAPNIYCFHNHTGSFTKEEKEALSQANQKIIHQRYPDYRLLVRQTITNNLYEHIRKFILLLLCSKNSSRTILRIEHTLGGGSHFALIDYVKKHGMSYHILVLKVDPRKRTYYLDSFYKDYKSSWDLNSLQDLWDLFEHIKIDEVLINQFVCYYELKAIMEKLAIIKKQYNTRITMNIRDFYPICPSIRLLDSNYQPCDPNNEEICRECYHKIEFQPNNTVKDISSITEWREMWRTFFRHVDSITVFSNHTKNTILSVYKDVIPEDNINVEMIEIDYLRKVREKNHNHNEIRIAVLGVIVKHKGPHIVRDMALAIEQNEKYKNVKIIIMGMIDPAYNHPLIEQNGEYAREELPDLMEENNIDIIFIPSICGETFSRTTQEAILMDIPVAVFNIGAPPERVATYEKGLIIDTMDGKTALEEITNFIKRLRENN